ncbi:MAG TPA: ribosome-associated translation inhibitor RaiA [Candidatus Saccharimonadales bacterium]|nr:ribosome-associated translation inhibitor RaiA [Candidatus Saccharimonadales bacterium]
MLTQIEITGVNLDLGADIKKYARKKIGSLDKYLPRHARKTAHAEVKLRQTNNRLGNKYECEIVVTVPDKQIAAKESTMNMFAAVDIVEQKIKNQFVKYKQEHVAHLKTTHPNILRRLRARFLG